MPRLQVDPDRIALAVQQPWAELIVRGIKTLEIRSSGVRVRGPIYIYASRRPSSHAAALRAAERAGLEIDGLPRGVVVGTAELVESRPAVPQDAADACVVRDHLTGRFAWRLEHAKRFDPPMSVDHVPCGIWFYPFRHA
jgi:ASCH domain